MIPEVTPPVDCESVDTPAANLEVVAEDLGCDLSAVVSEPGEIYPNGDTFTGQLVDGLRSGFGKYIHSTGVVYTGMFVAGKRQGIGKLVFASSGESCCAPSYYHGEFEDGLMSGGGTYRYANGDVYSGGWFMNSKHGHGTYYYANEGGSLMGDWNRGQFVSGDWVLPNGHTYTGHFENGRPIGKGAWKISSDLIQGEYIGESWKFTLLS